MKAALQSFYCFLFLLLIQALCISTYAQQIKLVSGRVIDKETKKPFKDEAVWVYAFNTIAGAQEAKDAIDNQTVEIGRADGEATTDAGGNYEIRVAETGALIFKVGVAPCVLEAVNYRMEINVSIDAGIMIAPIEILGISKDINPIETAPTMIGNKLMMHNTFPIPAQFGKTNGRLIIQPYVVQCDNLDTICYSHPII